MRSSGRRRSPRSNRFRFHSQQPFLTPYKRSYHRLASDSPTPDSHHRRTHTLLLHSKAPDSTVPAPRVKNSDAPASGQHFAANSVAPAAAGEGKTHGPRQRNRSRFRIGWGIGGRY